MNELTLFSSSVLFGLGFGFVFALVTSGKPFILEATNTLIGSFVLRGNIANVEPPLIPEQEPHDQLSDIA